MATLNGYMVFLNNDDQSRSIGVIVEDMEVSQAKFDEMTAQSPAGTPQFNVTVKKTEDAQGRTDRRVVLTEI